MYKMELKTFGLTIVTLAFLFAKAKGLCMPEHPQTAVCRSKFGKFIKLIIALKLGRSFQHFVEPTFIFVKGPCLKKLRSLIQISKRANVCRSA